MSVLLLPGLAILVVNSMWFHPIDFHLLSVKTCAMFWEFFFFLMYLVLLLPVKCSPSSEKEQRLNEQDTGWYKHCIMWRAEG